MNKYFIITVDTEGDNLWDWKEGQPITTENTLYIERFQKLCDKYGFKPVYLTSYEMLLDNRYITMVKQWQEEDRCEVALHLHAWNNPPYFELSGKHNGNPYLIEYPVEFMHKKFDELYRLFVEKIGCSPFSHRAGRWGMNTDYFLLLKKYGVMVDCSYTPGVDWSKSVGRTIAGPDYSEIKNGVTYVEGIMEVPMTIKTVHKFQGSGFLSKMKGLIKGRAIQLRPAICNLDSMKALVDELKNDTSLDYLEFMLHSSEVMPGGSPYYPDEFSVNKEFEVMESLFDYVVSQSYKGITLKEYYNNKTL